MTYRRRARPIVKGCHVLRSVAVIGSQGLQLSTFAKLCQSEASFAQDPVEDLMMSRDAKDQLHDTYKHTQKYLSASSTFFFLSPKRSYLAVRNAYCYALSTSMYGPHCHHPNLPQNSAQKRLFVRHLTTQYILDELFSGSVSFSAKLSAPYPQYDLDMFLFCNPFAFPSVTCLCSSHIGSFSKLVFGTLFFFFNLLSFVFDSFDCK